MQRFVILVVLLVATEPLTSSVPGFPAVLLGFSGVGARPAVAEEPVDALQTATQRRFYRILTGRSEKSRSNLVARLAASREETHAEIDVLIAATETLLTQRSETVRDAKPSSPSGPTPESLLSLIAAIGMDPSPAVVPFLSGALHHEDEFVSMAAMDAVGKNGLKEALEDLVAQIKRPEFDARYGYRFALVRSIAQLHDPLAIEWLRKLHRQLDGQLRHEIEGRLADVDVRDFMGDQERMQEWRDENPISSILDQVFLKIEPTHAEDDESGQSSSLQLQPVSSSSQKRPKLTRSSYYGIDLHAARMLFIIDRSGSMREPSHYGTRLQSAKSELVQTINGLSPETEFGIMAFDTTIQFYRNELMNASDENKREAIAFVDRILLGQKTNTYGALVDATEFDDQLEAVFLLTDGRPTFGQVTRPDYIIKEIVKRNRMRHLKFHTIGIGTLGNTVMFLRTLAEETGGEFRQVP